jgi:hypothetical protein
MHVRSRVDKRSWSDAFLYVALVERLCPAQGQPDPAKAARAAVIARGRTAFSRPTFLSCCAAGGAPRARRDGMRLREYLGFEMGLGRQPVGYRQGIARTAFTPYFPTLVHLLHLSLDAEMAKSLLLVMRGATRRRAQPRPPGRRAPSKQRGFSVPHSLTPPHARGKRRRQCEAAHTFELDSPLC